MDSNKIKKGLGRGLSSLIGETKVETQKNKLLIGDLKPNKFQPRKNFDEENVDREKLQICLKKYLEHNNLEVDWESIKNSPTELLVNSLCLLSPYKPEEKQALLEAKTLSERNEILIAMTEMSMSSESGTEQIQ